MKSFWDKFCKFEIFGKIKSCQFFTNVWEFKSSIFKFHNCNKQNWIWQPKTVYAWLFGRVKRTELGFYCCHPDLKIGLGTKYLGKYSWDINWCWIWFIKVRINVVYSFFIQTIDWEEYISHQLISCLLLFTCHINSVKDRKDSLFNQMVIQKVIHSIRNFLMLCSVWSLFSVAIATLTTSVVIC